ncbi:MAG: metallophosphoesterase [Cyanobacteria bacterium]|nr:metallophosphoesterase [Cyanobacteriota bacterium]
MTPPKASLRLQGSAALARRRLVLAAVAAVASLLALPRLVPAQASAAPAGASLHVLAVADTGSGNKHQMAVGQQMALANRRQPVDLVLLAGDNVYPDGDPAQLDRVFVKPYQELLANKVPFFAVLGNHDIRTRNGEGQLAYPALGMGGRWYSLRRGPVEFFLLDTNVNAAWQHQLPWLKGALARSTAPWKVVVGHHPLYTAGFYGDDAAGIARLTPLFKRYGVQLYINGHDHNYERTQRINGTTYLTVGGGGAYLRPVLPNERTAYATSQYSFAELNFEPNKLRLQGWNAEGRRIDQAVLSVGAD